MTSEQQRQQRPAGGEGLSATGRTADEFRPGQPGAGTDYGDPGGLAEAGEEQAGSAGQEGPAGENAEREEQPPD